MFLFLYGEGTIKTDGSPDERSQFGALGDIGKGALRLVSRVKLEYEHEDGKPGDEMSMAELEAMSKDELLEHMRSASISRCGGRHLQGHFCFGAASLGGHHEPTTRLHPVRRCCAAVPRLRWSCTPSEYKTCDQKLRGTFTYKGRTQMKELAQSVKSTSGLDLLYKTVLKWGNPGKNQVRSNMALLQLRWKEAKHEDHMTNLAGCLDKLMTARHELAEAKQAIGHEVFFTMVLDSFDGGKQREAYRADWEPEAPS